MAAADTVIGIVGGLVLVAAMVGVFLYEYNNVPVDDPWQPPAPGIAADGDIDGDGVPNQEDDDVDGDGVPNADDDQTAVRTQGSGSLGPTSPAGAESFQQEIHVDPGAALLNVTLQYTVAAPAPVPRVPAFQVTLLGPEGEAVATGTSEQTGTDVTVRIETVDLEPAGGMYTLQVQEGEAGLGGSFTFDAWVVYG